MSFNHPRRTTKTTSSALTPSANASTRPTGINTNMLRKGATFHTPPPSPDCELAYHLKIPSLPRRSHSTLEDVVDAHKRRVALTLGDIDRSLSAAEDKQRSPATRKSLVDVADPVPQGVLDHAMASKATPADSDMTGTASQEPSAIGRHSLRPRHNRRPSRYSDSGIGSSIGSKHGKEDGDSLPTSATCVTAITRSAAAHRSTIEKLPRLSARATGRIHEHILKPLLAKKSFKDYHSIVEDCPRRINNKEIVCLRDLEKSLILMAPERTKTAALYLDFCLTSIRCIQATVEFLSDREQTRPHDRPYTNGYFVDLVDQIKQYAQQVQAVKEKEAKGEKLSEMDPESTDEVRLHGGVAKTGRPAELIRVKKNGKAVSIATGEPVDLTEDTKDGVVMKRSLSEEVDNDEAILRSMARRKRSASAAELAPKRCRELGCNKEFKRPCDLTKHEKTHSRPWKCPVSTCKYHEYGWPTEKEMDRHHNDKHSNAPALFECRYPPCPYRSKRESNCKQHMEKAHGWQYVRSKNNGKNREKSILNPLPTPQTTNIPTPESDANTMHTPDDEDFDMGAFNDGPTLYEQGNQNQLDFPIYPSDIDLFAPNQLQLDFSPASDPSSSVSSDQSPYTANHLAPGQDHFQDNFHDLTNAGDFNLYDHEDLYSAHVQLPSPSQDVFQRALVGSTFETSGIPFNTDPIPHISPVGHGNAMLYTPTSLCDVDEGFDDFVPNDTNLGSGDFQLYPSSTVGAAASNCQTTLFGELPRANAFVGLSAQDLLDFYDASTQAATNGVVDWSSADHYSSYHVRH